MDLEKVKAIIFDLDWTLIQSTVDFKKMKRTIITIFTSYSVDRNFFSDELKSNVIISIGKKALLDKHVSDVTMLTLMNQINTVVNQIELENVSSTKAIVGAVETLRSLKHRGIKIGVLTRGCREYAEKALVVTGMRELVDILLARDDVNKPKPNPHHLLQIIKYLEVVPEQVLLVGDSTLDASCAQRAGVRFIGVLTGVASEEELRKYKSFLLITNLTDLIAQ